MQDSSSDWQLAQRAAAGDQASWKQIFDTTCDRLFSVLCYQVGDRDEAQDLLQETYIQAHRSLAGYRGEAPLMQWLRVIAIRKALDWKRGALQRIKRTVLLTETTASVPANDGGVHFDSERSAFREALARLSPPQRASLLLREWEGWSFREIAEALGCKESTARVHHTRARDRMRGILRQSAPAIGAEGLEGQQI